MGNLSSRAYPQKVELLIGNAPLDSLVSELVLVEKKAKAAQLSPESGFLCSILIGVKAVDSLPRPFLNFQNKDVGIPGDGIDGEKGPLGRSRNHGLHQHSHGRIQEVYPEALGIGKGFGAKEGHPATKHSFDSCFLTVDIEEGSVLSHETLERAILVCG